MKYFVCKMQWKYIVAAWNFLGAVSWLANCELLRKAISVAVHYRNRSKILDYLIVIYRMNAVWKFLYRSILFFSAAVSIGPRSHIEKNFSKKPLFLPSEFTHFSKYLSILVEIMVPIAIWNCSHDACWIFQAQRVRYRTGPGYSKLP